MNDTTNQASCDACNDSVTDALARTVRLTVDRSQIDAQRLCPDCFAEWVNRYEEEMQSGQTTLADPDGSDIIID